MLELPRYPFTSYAVRGAPEDRGVVLLMEGDEVIYIGAAEGGIQGFLLALLDGGTPCVERATHYTWEIRRDAKAREAELLALFQAQHRREPRCNGARA